MKMANAVVAMQLIKACVTRHNVMFVANSVQKGTPTENRFKNESVSSGWYQAWLSRMIAKGILKISCGTFTHEVTREPWCTSSKLEDFCSLHDSELLKAGIA